MKLRLILTLTVILGQQGSKANPVVDLLKQGKVVFGSMVSVRTEDGGAKMAADPNIDFAFYDLEHSDFHIAGLKGFIKGIRNGGSAKAVLVRIPAIGNEPDKAAKNVAQVLEAGADG